MRQEYRDPIKCPVCGKIFGEWEDVRGEVVISKWCANCKKVVYISKNLGERSHKDE